ncbi:MAG: hypothetical protein J2P54_11320 [Bradyrhizobiaceae bacterium]|nr:hypothetical protein [Bradyrhizobiaceae bacterium]
MSPLIIVLISSGLVIWDPYFYDLTSTQKRVAVAAVMMMCVWIVHVYAAIWVPAPIPIGEIAKPPIARLSIRSCSVTDGTFR